MNLKLDDGGVEEKLLKLAHEIKDGSQMCGIYDLDCRVVGLSAPCIQFLGMDSSDVLYRQELWKWLFDDNHGLADFIAKGVKYIIEKKSSLADTYLINGLLCQSTFLPIIDGKRIIGMKMSLSPINNESFNVKLIRNLFNRYGTSGFSSTNASGIVLSDFEEVVVSGLILGYSLDEIAMLSQKSKSYVSKVISVVLCPKFGVFGYSSKVLTDKLVDAGFNYFMSSKFVHHEVNHSSKSLINQNITLNWLQKNIIKNILARKTYSEIGEELGYSKAMIGKVVTKELYELFRLEDKTPNGLINVVNNDSSLWKQLHN